MRDFAFDVFLSHSSKDKPRVRHLAERLRGSGLRVWFDEWTISPGDNIVVAIEKGIDTARTNVLCMSPAALGSGWVELERYSATFRDPAETERRFIPVLLADLTVPNVLRRYAYVDLRDDSETAINTLIEACRVTALPSSSPIAAPFLETPKTAATSVDAKVVLLGNAGVGKTSLAHRLMEDRFVRTSATHGTQVWSQLLRPESESGLHRQLMFWDLAGESEYRFVHRLHLDDSALALIVVDPQRDEELADAAYWLRVLRGATERSDLPRVPALLVPARVDTGNLTLRRAALERFMADHDVDAMLPTSAKTGENCSDLASGGLSPLKQLIAASIPWAELQRTWTSPLLADLKTVLLAMRESIGAQLLRFAELRQRLQLTLPDQMFGESEVRAAVNSLVRLGVAYTFDFGDLVLFGPELLDRYAAAVVRAARAHPDGIGSVREDAIYGTSFDFSGVDRLPNRPDEELLLRAMVQLFLDHALCIAEDTPQGRFLVFPSQYRRDREDSSERPVLVSYTFEGDWEATWTTLVVRLWYSQEFLHRELWRNSAEFASPHGSTLGLKVTPQHGHTATLSVYFDTDVADELKVIFIEYVHRHLARRGTNVTRNRHYVCSNCGQPVSDLQAVQKRLMSGKTFITCQHCDERVELIDVIERRLAGDPMARRVAAMEETATRQLDAQAIEQILKGHVMAVSGEANQIFRQLSRPTGIDAELEFKSRSGKASGKKIFVHLMNSATAISTDRSGRTIVRLPPDYAKAWVKQPHDVYVVIRDRDQTIRWMNITRYLESHPATDDLFQFEGERLTSSSVWRVRDAELRRRRLTIAKTRPS